MQGEAYSAADRVLARIKVHPLGCWEYLGKRTEKGYGRVKVGTRDLRAHRVVYEDWFGPIPDGLTIDHLCLNPSCVNPAHLEPVTARENTRRQVASGRHYLAGGVQTHCQNGHAFDAANTIVRPNGARRCRICTNHRQRERWRAKNPTAQGGKP